jgi:hypothetical protein
VHPVVIIDDDKSYDAYVRGLETFWSALLDIKASGLNVPGVGVVPVVFKMCCDMKALLLFAGLGSANSNHACFHCCEPLACRACCLPEVRSACELGHPFDALTISRDVGLAAASFALSDDDCKMPVSEQAIGFREAAILAMSDELNKLKATPLRNKCIAEGIDLVLPTRAKTKADMIARYISTKMA